MIDAHHLKNLKLKWIFFLSKWFQLSWMTGNSSLFQTIENKNTSKAGKKDFCSESFFFLILFHTFCFAVTATVMMETFQKLQRSVYTNSQILSSQSNYIWAFCFRFRDALHMIDARYLKNLKLKWIFFLSKWFQLSWMTGQFLSFPNKWEQNF